MMRSILVFISLFLISSSSYSQSSNEDEVCEWIIEEPLQEYLDDPRYSTGAFAVVVSDGDCEYGMTSGNTPQEAIDDAIKDCEKFRKENDIEGLCMPYAMGKEIVWGKNIDLNISEEVEIVSDDIQYTIENLDGPLIIDDLPEEFKGAKKIYPKYVNVFGIHIFASKKVRDIKLLHAANIMAEYLDNNEDGTPDNPLVIKKMLKNNAAMLMSYTENEWEREMERFMDMYGHTEISAQSLYDEETNPGGGRFDGALEEILHLITEKGYGPAYPKELGKSSSLLAKAMDKARGGKFKKVPKKYPKDSWYSYDDMKIGQGRENSKTFLTDNRDVLGSITSKVRSFMGLNGETEKAES